LGRIGYYVLLRGETKRGSRTCRNPSLAEGWEGTVSHPTASRGKKELRGRRRPHNPLEKKFRRGSGDAPHLPDLGGGCKTVSSDKKLVKGGKKSVLIHHMEGDRQSKDAIKILRR